MSDQPSPVKRIKVEENPAEVLEDEGGEVDEAGNGSGSSPGGGASGCNGRNGQAGWTATKDEKDVKADVALAADVAVAHDRTSASGAGAATVKTEGPAPSSKSSSPLDSGIIVPQDSSARPSSASYGGRGGAIGAREDRSASSVGRGGAIGAREDRARILQQEKDEREKMQVLVSNFTEDQLDRYEMFRRAAFPKAAIKRVMQTLTGCSVGQNVVIAMAGITKVFAGSIVEEALDYMETIGETGPLKPKHVREAARRLRLKHNGKLPKAKRSSPFL